MALFLIEIPDEEVISEANFIHSHQLDQEGVEIHRLPDKTIKDYEQRLLANEWHGAN